MVICRICGVENGGNKMDYEQIRKGLLSRSRDGKLSDDMEEFQLDLLLNIAENLDKIANTLQVMSEREKNNEVINATFF